jgi:hypothetical protein
MIKAIGILSLTLPMMATALSAPRPAWAEGNYVSSCEAAVYATGNRLGIPPNQTAPGTDGPNSISARDRLRPSGQAQPRSLGPTASSQTNAMPADERLRISTLLTQALIAARRNDEFLCEARLNDAMEAAGVGP